VGTNFWGSGASSKLASDQFTIEIFVGRYLKLNLEAYKRGFTGPVKLLNIDANFMGQNEDYDVLLEG
jgi:hypothetical protein